MGTVTELVRDHNVVRREPSRLRPATLRVRIEAGLAEDPATGLASIHVSVSGARAPVRLYLYVDGDLAGAWGDVEVTHELRVGDVKTGRHAVTARAVDALGRWAGTSTVIDCEPNEVPVQGE
jgi:hypothetical protein